MLLKKSHQHQFLNFKFFDDGVITFIADMTNLFIQRERDKHNLSTDASEMQFFIMMLITGSNQFLRQTLYKGNSHHVNNQ